MLHGGLLVLALLFPLYKKLIDWISPLIVGCFLHDRLFLYCPFCGGTRAVEALLHLQLAQAWQYNPMVVLGIFIFIALDVLALIRLLRGKRKLYLFPAWGWIVAVIAFVLYGVLRNYLMLRYGYDPTGDLGRFWRG
jgi:uncharacterized membrane protein